jgi:polycomb protein EED
VPPQVCVLSFQGNGSHRNEVLSLDWSPVDPDLLLSGGMDNHIKIW